MHQDIATTPAADGAVGPLDLVRDQAQRYATSTTAAATRTAYRLDWDCIARWTGAHDLDALPARPETVGLYLTAMAQTLKVNTLEWRLGAIAHSLTGHQLDTRHPAIRDVLHGIRRAQAAPGVRPPRRRWTW
jgi:hypothetical protein